MIGWTESAVKGFGCTYRVKRFKVLGFTVYTKWSRA